MKRSCPKLAKQGAANAAARQACCYFPAMALRCQEYVTGCPSCAAASPRRGERVPPKRPGVPSGPWRTVQIDTLELGASQNGRFHCVLVIVDSFTKWVEVVPLPRHDAASVARAFVSVCTHWGPPQIVRCDNGTEFVNAIMDAVFDVFGVRVHHGAVRHPQSQGSTERFNRTLLTLIWKTLEDANDWKSALDFMLHYYRIRPHSFTKNPPMAAMVGWEPRELLVQRDLEELSESAWMDRQRRQAAQTRDFLEGELSALDFMDEPDIPCPFRGGDAVLLRRPHRHKKRVSPYESTS